jgi:hypothetical protein
LPRGTPNSAATSRSGKPSNAVLQQRLKLEQIIMAAMANGLRMIYAYALTLGILLESGSSLAQTPDPDLPAIDPPGKGRVMTHDDLTSTSNCIGNPITPLCAVETVIA